ncbi:MAG: glycosyltransferase family 4 protein [Clostridium sp.]|nr:glycosyltransferase family 4 protein [Clostridium sp.]
MHSKKKILVCAHYFYPDVASTGQILTELCEGLSDTFDITVICTVPSYSGKIEEKYKNKKFYEEDYKNIKLIRVSVPEFDKKKKLSRVANIVTYFINAIKAIRKLPNQDYIFTISQPPILGGLLGVIAKKLKKGKLIYNIQDFNPEQTMAVGYTKNKPILKAALKADKYSCKNSDKIILVGRDMIETLKNRFKNANVPKNVVINNWIDEENIRPLSKDDINVKSIKEKYDIDNTFIIMYSGNIGLYYDLENLIKVIGKFKDRDDVLFLFAGDGTVKNKIENYSKEQYLKNVKFIPYQPKEKLNYSLNLADVHLVVSAKGIKGVSVPSKLYGVMAAGKPVIGVLDEGSEARYIIEESDCGICVEPGNYDEVYKTINYILENKNKMKFLGNNGRSYLERKLKKQISIDKYRKEILSI